MKLAQSEVSIDSRGQRAITQRSEEEAKLCAAEHARDLHETATLRVMLVGGEALGSLGFPSQRIHLKGAQGNQTKSLPVSM